MGQDLSTTIAQLCERLGVGADAPDLLEETERDIECLLQVFRNAQLEFAQQFASLPDAVGAPERTGFERQLGAVLLKTLARRAELYSSYHRTIEALEAKAAEYRAELIRYAVEEPERRNAALELDFASVRRSYAVLSRNGWFPLVYVSEQELDSIVSWFNTGKSRRADERLCRVVQANLKTIEADLRKAFPLRDRPLRDAFWAHRKRRYSLSIPVLLAQCDGISADVLGAHLFMRRNRRPATAGLIEALPQPWRSILEPFTIALPIADSTTEPQFQTHSLNRHAVLHGASSDYGTRLGVVRQFPFCTTSLGRRLCLAKAPANFGVKLMRPGFGPPAEPAASSPA